MQAIGDEPNVNWLNRISQIQVVSTTCIPVAGSEGPENVFTFHGYDKLEKDSPFADKVYRITEGNYPQGSEDIVVNQFLAEDNGIQAVDKITFEILDGTKQEAVVCGLFLSGMERSQTENVQAVSRIENQIYGTAEIGQTSRITFLIFVLTVTAGSLIIGLLLAMWMRSRKTEIAVLISLGMSKENLFSQMILEEVILYFIAFAGAEIAAKLLLPRISNSMAVMQGNSIALELSFIWHLGVLCIGLIGVVILTGIAIFPYMKKPVKETLSEMEG